MTSLKEMFGVALITLDRIKALNAMNFDAKEGSWILGGGWNNDFWGGELPSASWIDEISPHNPIWLIRMDGHMALANSPALRIAGVTSLTEDPVGGTIMGMPTGEPTGLLIDAAMELVTPWVKEISVDERREALFRASKYALTRGVTTVIDLGRYFPSTTDEADELSWKDFQGAINHYVNPEWDKRNGMASLCE